MDNDISQSPRIFRTGITIYPSHGQAINQLIDEFMTRCPGLFALVADTSGCIITTAGEKEGLNTIALGSLVAADLSASQEMAFILGHSPKNQFIFRESGLTNTFITEAGPNLALFIQVSKETPIGWARLLIRRMSQQLAEIIATPSENVQDLELGLGEQQISDLADAALDAIWS